jgi:predicted phosphoribosyltransferase
VHEVTTRLQVPLDVFLVRKIGVPGRVDLAMGAIAFDGVEVLNQDVIHDLGILAREIPKMSNSVTNATDPVRCSSGESKTP